jgi:hypothetical protein
MVNKHQLIIMAEEAMVFIGSSYFNFNEDGDYIPYGSSGTHDVEEQEESFRQRYGNHLDWPSSH